MTILNKVTEIRHLYIQGMRDHEICERLKTSTIFTRNVIARMAANEPAMESKHYINRRRKGALVRAQIINEDPLFEARDRFEMGGV